MSSSYSIRVHLKFSIIKRIFFKNLSSFLKDFQNVVYLFIGHAGLELRTWCKFRALHATSWNLFKKQNQLKRERDVQRSGLDPRSFGPYLMFRGAWESHQFSLSTKATQGHPEGVDYISLKVGQARFCSHLMGLAHDSCTHAHSKRVQDLEPSIPGFPETRLCQLISNSSRLGSSGFPQSPVTVFLDPSNGQVTAIGV